ncbi:MAG: hypothetical protein GY703_24945 [Gammaproteobacteria bacterium]|nr:hypothetical protein [Gammaproteobacteria bacterium]
MRAASVGQGIAGKRCDFLATDDAIASVEEASSPDKRSKMFRWYLDEARTRARLESGKYLRELFIGTRWWADDLQGMLLETEGATWDLIEMPLLCTDPESDVMQRSLGQPLWDAFPPERIAEVQRDPVSFQSLYQQRPIDAAGDWLDPGCIKVYDTVPEDLSIYCAMDLATSDSAKSDFTVIGIVGVDHERNIWILDWFRRRINPEDVVIQAP